MIKKAEKYVPLLVVLLIIQVKLGNSTSDIQWMTTFSTILLAILLEAMPFMMLGSVVSGLIEVYLPRELMMRMIPKNKAASLPVFGLLGILFPVCECGIVPVVRRLLSKGVPLSCAITYMLAAPIVQPVVFVSTMIAFNNNWKLAVMRITGGYLIAVLIGLLSALFLDSRTKEHLVFLRKDSHCECCHGHHHAHDAEACSCGDDEAVAASIGSEKLLSVMFHASRDFIGTGNFLIFGSFLAAGMQTFISQDALSSLGSGPALGPLVMMAVAFSVSLCSNADAFVASAFTQFTIPARMAFLVMGPMVDIKLIAMYQGFLSRKATLFIFGLAALFAYLFSVALRLLGV